MAHIPRSQRMIGTDTLVDKRDDVVDTFYVVLTCEQKMVVDTRLANQCRHHQHHGETFLKHLYLPLTSYTLQPARCTKQMTLGFALDVSFTGLSISQPKAVCWLTNSRENAG